MGFIGLRELGDEDSQVIGRRKRRGKERSGSVAVARQCGASSSDYLKADKKVATLLRIVGFRIQVRMILVSVEITAWASGEEKSLRRSDKDESELSGKAEGA